jgi:hypothetical protein
MFQGEAEEGPILLYQVVVVDSSARHGENDVVILDRFRIWYPLEGVVIAVPMKSICHLSSAG